MSTSNTHRNRKSPRSGSVALLRAVPPATIALASALHPPFSVAAGTELARVRSSSDWLAVHLVLAAAVTAMDATLLDWPGSHSGLWRRVRRVGVWVNLATYPLFLGVDGLGGWLLATTRLPSGASQVPLRLAADHFFSSWVVASVAWFGAAGWIVAAVAIALDRRRRRWPMGPAVVLLIGTVWLGVAHAFPLGTVGGALIAAAALWSAMVDPRRLGDTAG